MSFARRTFRIAGIYGLLNLLPQYFMEERIGRDYPPPITHPEMFYGFLGVAAAWQLVYLLISSDPARFRPVMPLAVIAKSSFGIPTVILFFLGRVAPIVHFFAWVDLSLGALFAVSYFKTAPESAARAAK